MDGSQVPRRGSPLPTHTLVDLAADGNAAAVEALCERFRPRLVAWAHGRLPDYARTLLDTDDLVQEAMIRSLERIRAFKGQEKPSFLAYVIKAIRNGIIDEIRRTRRRPNQVEVDEAIPDALGTPLDACLRRESEAAYRAALEHLSPGDQELVIGRYEMQMSTAELAIDNGFESAAAARMAALRAMRKLVQWMPEEGTAMGKKNGKEIGPLATDRDDEK